MRTLLLIALGMAAFCSGIHAEEPGKESKKEVKTEIPVYGEIQFAELLQNPEEREKLKGKVIDLVGDLYSMSIPTEERPKIETIGFGKTYQTTIYRVQCFLKKPLTKQEFEEVSRSNFVVVRGRCSFTVSTKEVGADLWYNFSVVLADASIRFWEPLKSEERDERDK